MIIYKKIAAIIFFIVLLFCFFKINKFNYEKYYIEIKNNIVNHPDHLQKKEIVKLSSFWFKNLKADYYWLNTIQYIWDNAISSEYKKYLYIMLDLITELNPYFKHPYIIWQLLLPAYNQRYENLDKSKQELYINQWINLWLKWIKNFCNKGKINNIIKEDDLTKIINEDKYKNPCKTYSIPYYLAYIYYFYKKEPLKASDYYKIASANKDSVPWSKIMASIMKWKGWDREKSIYMFLNLAKEIEKSDKGCYAFSSLIENEFTKIIKWKDSLNKDFIQNIELVRNKVFEELTEENEENILSETKCKNYANKAVREINLLYIENWNKKYKQDHNWKSALTAKQLYDLWYIKFLPTDFQQYKNKNYWMMYYYNKEIWHFDYEIRNYDEW